MKYVSLDIETTGLDSRNCKVIQVAAVVDDLITPVGQLPSFSAFIGWENLPFEPYALKLHMQTGLLQRYFMDNNKDTFSNTMNALSRFLDVHYRLHDSKERRTFAGKNLAGFDLPFLKANGGGDSFTENLLKTIRHRIIDPATSFTNFFTDTAPASLDDCKRRAGINNGSVSHDARDDAYDVVNVVRFIANKNTTLPR